MPNCAVLSCRNSNRNVGLDNGHVSYHRFPSEPDVKNKWIEATGKKNWFPTNFSRICSVHFDEGSFKETNKFRRLTTKAIPTIDVLKISNNDDNIDENLTENKPSLCNTPRKRKLGENIQQPSTSNENPPVNTPKKRKLEHKLKLAQQKIIQKNKLIKRLREQNRRKGLKILTLVSLLQRLKLTEKSFISEEQANFLVTSQSQ